MNRTEFVVAIALILFVAFLLGWFAAWLVNRFSRVTVSDMAELEDMAKSLHEAEEQRDEAITYLQYREHELTTKLAAAEAELRATMDGLREARHESAELRRYLESLNARPDGAPTSGRAPSVASATDGAFRLRYRPRRRPRAG
jgi:hypothetical protein